MVFSSTCSAFVLETCRARRRSSPPPATQRPSSGQISSSRFVHCRKPCWGDRSTDLPLCDVHANAISQPSHPAWRPHCYRWWSSPQLHRGHAINQPSSKHNGVQSLRFGDIRPCRSGSCQPRGPLAQPPAGFHRSDRRWPDFVCCCRQAIIPP